MGIRGAAILGFCLITAELLAQNAPAPSKTVAASATNVLAKPEAGKFPEQANSTKVEFSGSPLGSGNVLTLTGNGNYLDLPAEPFEGLTVATLECWVKWHTFARNEHVFEFDAAKRVKVGNVAKKPDLEFIAAASAASTQTNAQPAAVRPAELADASPFEFEKHEAAASNPE